jgi:hypothetical protein
MDNDCALLCWFSRRPFLLDSFVMESTNPCRYSLSIRSYLVFYSFDSTSHAMNDCPCQVTWAIGLELQITTCISRFPVHFRGQFRTPLHDEGAQGRRSIINFHFHCQFDGRSKAYWGAEETRAILVAYVAEPRKCRRRIQSYFISKSKSNAIPVTGLGGL